MLPGSNVRIWTARPGFNAATKATLPGAAYLSDVLAVMGSLPANQFVNLPPELSYKAIYKVQVDVGTDIAEGDTLIKVVERDGATTWPRFLAGVGNYSWRVRYLDPNTPMLLPRLTVYVELVRAGGASHG